MNCFLSYLSVGSHWVLSMSCAGFQSHSVVEISGIFVSEKSLYIFGEEGEEICIPADMEFTVCEDGSFRAVIDNLEIIMEEIDSE